MKNKRYKINTNKAIEILKNPNTSISTRIGGDAFRYLRVANGMAIQALKRNASLNDFDLTLITRALDFYAQNQDAPDETLQSIKKIKKNIKQIQTHNNN